MKRWKARGKCLREGKLESDIMPLDETVKLMKIMDGMRAQWGLVYPGEQAAGRCGELP